MLERRERSAVAELRVVVQLIESHHRSCWYADRLEGFHDLCGCPLGRPGSNGLGNGGTNDPSQCGGLLADALILFLDEKVGPAGARNTGLVHAETPFVAFVDSHVEVTPDQLLGLCRHFAHEKVALLGPRVRGVSRSERPTWFERYDVDSPSLDLGRSGRCRSQPPAWRSMPGA